MSLKLIPISIVVPEEMDKGTAQKITAAVATLLAQSSTNHSIDPNLYVNVDKLKSTFKPRFSEFRLGLEIQTNATKPKPTPDHEKLVELERLNTSYKSVIRSFLTAKKEAVIYTYRELLKHVKVEDIVLKDYKGQLVQSLVNGFAELMQIIENDVLENEYTLDEMLTDEFRGLVTNWISMYFIRQKLETTKQIRSEYASRIATHLVEYLYHKQMSDLR